MEGRKWMLPSNEDEDFDLPSTFVEFDAQNMSMKVTEAETNTNLATESTVMKKEKLKVFKGCQVDDFFGMIFRGSL